MAGLDFWSWASVDHSLLLEYIQEDASRRWEVTGLQNSSTLLVFTIPVSSSFATANKLGLNIYYSSCATPSTTAQLSVCGRWEYTFAPREYLHQHLETRFSQALAGIVMYSPETSEIAKPSELLTSVKSYMSILQCVETGELRHHWHHPGFNNVLLQQTQQVSDIMIITTLSITTLVKGIFMLLAWISTKLLLEKNMVRRYWDLLPRMVLLAAVSPSEQTGLYLLTYFTR